MITKKTVLILGAGASMPYEFPSGASLVQQICSNLTNRHQGRKVIDDHFMHDYLSGEVDNFIKDLSLSGRQSIDVFLMNRPEYERIGKVAIAAILIPCESHSNLFSVDKSKWYQFLFNNLGTNFEEFGENKLAIITYNYDRSLEFYLKTVLEHTHKKNEGEALEQLKKIPIIHLHGNLGNLPGMGEKYIRKYEKKLSTTALSYCENTIKVVHENIDGQPQFTEANKLIKEAETICFLGFGYDKTNLDRLSLKYSDITGKRLFGTAFDIGNARRSWLKGYFDRNTVTFGNRQETIDMFLDNYLVIVRPD